MSSGGDLPDDHRPEHVPGVRDTVAEGEEGPEGRADREAVQHDHGVEECRAVVLQRYVRT